jgi:hypothetical protein
MTVKRVLRKKGDEYMLYFMYSSDTGSSVKSYHVGTGWYDNELVRKRFPEIPEFGIEVRHDDFIQKKYEQQRYCPFTDKGEVAGGENIEGRWKMTLLSGEKYWEDELKFMPPYLPNVEGWKLRDLEAKLTAKIKEIINTNSPHFAPARIASYLVNDYKITDYKIDKHG